MDTKEIMQAIRRTRIKTLYSAYSEGAITYGDYRYSLRDYINRARVLLGQAPYTPNEYEIAWQNRTLAAENWTRARDEIANVILRNF
jgi:hypothetical protein